MTPDEKREEAKRYREQGIILFRQARRSYQLARELEEEAIQDELKPPTIEERFSRIFQ